MERRGEGDGRGGGCKGVGGEEGRGKTGGRTEGGGKGESTVTPLNARVVAGKPRETSTNWK